MPAEAIPQDKFDEIVSVVREVSEESTADFWCGYAQGPLAVSVGSCDDDCGSDGRIVVRPNWDGGSSATSGVGAIRRGTVTVNAFGSSTGTVRTRSEIKASVVHELMHIAFGRHQCGGDIGSNPFGFSPANCPFPDSVMANRGERFDRLSREDRLAACLVYNSDTKVGNLWQDINPTYR